jgi:hypothetical protein
MYEMLAPHHAISAIESSNLPAHKKSGIRAFYERVMGVTGGAVNAMGHVREGGAILRQGSEAALTGLALGWIDGEMGLDCIDNKAPIDGIIALAGLGGALVMANDPLGIAPDLRNAGSHALAVLAYRKTKAWRDEKNGKKPASSSAHGETDPILALASEL